jgi:hypothetical protein
MINPCTEINPCTDLFSHLHYDDRPSFIQKYPFHQIEQFADWVTNGDKDINSIIQDYDRCFTSYQAISALNRYYKAYSIPKNNNERRLIQAPFYRLKVIQRTLLKEMQHKFQLHSAATAVAGKNYINNASMHLGAKYVFKTDIVRFYENVTISKVDYIIRKYFPEHFDWMYERTALFYFMKNTSNATCLPTGAPTSPFISNLALYELDIELTQLASQLDGVYSRYLDDITLSFKQDLDSTTMNDIRNAVCKNINRHSWNFHANKTYWINPANDQFTVTGVDIRTDQKVTSQYIRQKIRPLIEISIDELINHRYRLSNHLNNKTASNFNTFEDVIPVFFSDCAFKLNYIQQVNKQQYNQLVDRIRTRLNHICKLRNENITNFFKQVLNKLQLHFNIQIDMPTQAVLDTTIKSFDEALLFALQCAYIKYESVRKLV